MYKIKEVADLLGISVRMLHHYDKIGLIIPDAFTKTGYRLYSDNNLRKLQQVLFFREMDFSLQEIKNILNDENFDQLQALRTHKMLLKEKVKRLERIIDTVDKTIDSIQGGRKMNQKEMFEAFDMTEIENHQKKYQEEVKEKYGHSNAYVESQEKTKKYTKEDWVRIQNEGSTILKGLANLMSQGPKDSKVQDLIGEYQDYISKNFYHCTNEILKGLGELYVSDIRFTKNIDKYQEGLSEFIKEAIDFYCEAVK